MNANQELTRWLEMATRGLSPATKEQVRAEIEAHYADAVGDYQAQGKTIAEAHQAALADLGDAPATARALRGTHQAKWRYVKAVAISLAVLLILPLLPVIYNISGSEKLASIVLRLTLLFSTLYVLYSLKVLLRLDVRPVDRSISFVIWCVIIADGARVLFWLLFNQPAITETAARSWWLAAPFLVKVLDLAALGGEFASGIALFLLGLDLMKVKNRLYGLRMPLCLLLMAVGCMEVGFITAIMAEAYLAAELLSAFGFLSIILTFALTSLLFFRAAYRGAAPPLRTV